MTLQVILNFHIGGQILCVSFACGLLSGLCNIFSSFPVLNVKGVFYTCHTHISSLVGANLSDRFSLVLIYIIKLFSVVGTRQGETRWRDITSRVLKLFCNFTPSSWEEITLNSYTLSANAIYWLKTATCFENVPLTATNYAQEF